MPENKGRIPILIVTIGMLLRRINSEKLPRNLRLVFPPQKSVIIKPYPHTRMSPKENSATAPGFNAPQQKAIEHGDGPLLVVAGAGTGKTRVIIERIRNLLETNPDLAGENILGL